MRSKYSSHAVACGLPLNEKATTKREKFMKIHVNERIRLSELQASDEAACVEHLKAKEIYEYTSRIPYPYTEADFQWWLNRVAQTTKEQGRNVSWAIRNEEEYLIGAIGFLEGFQIGKSHRAEIGYWLAKPYWGRGIMTDVVRTLCEFAFTEFALVKITAEVFAPNAASARVLEKCGFVQEGYLRQHYMKDGQFRDAKIFALLKAR
jgi:ribosomal-protein-alanine N-acetyltransferase